MEDMNYIIHDSSIRFDGDGMAELTLNTGESVCVYQIGYPTGANAMRDNPNYAVPDWIVSARKKDRPGKDEFLAFRLGGKGTDAGRYLKIIPALDVERMLISFNPKYGLVPVRRILDWNGRPARLEKLPPGPVQRKLL